MLSAVLRSDIAIEVSIKIIDAFVSMRRFLLSNASIFHIRNLLQKSKEDLIAMKKNGVGNVGTLIFKNLSKLPQFFKKEI
ncbi:hypothetical protein RZR97_08015 [Hydrogenimonas thermophila]|uniref:hypothetical protein n=1 Tax=Hydrogenimonas thermophila TaxID=223786 RepID=UPI0029370C5E|nr:hypothetical protein [Hydrogenimonas thermophila]WOE69054.1 hypothetical protein RZR91_08040 [Hydrogenimonas thermophila]WOE71564.1 hypothetical protein RZR97_08015 [Hydrogenimonas thermophila]